METFSFQFRNIEFFSLVSVGCFEPPGMVWTGPEKADSLQS